MPTVRCVSPVGHSMPPTRPQSSGSNHSYSIIRSRWGIAVPSFRNHCQNSSLSVNWRSDDGHVHSSKGWLPLSPNIMSCLRDDGHVTPSIGRLKSSPNASSSSDAGHETPSIGRLK